MMRRARILPWAAAVILTSAGCRDAFRSSKSEPSPPTTSVPAADAGGILTLDRVRQWNQALKNLAYSVAADTALARAIRLAPGEQMSAVAARLDSFPALRQAVERAGLSPREYMTINTALFRAMVTSYGLEEGRLDAVPEGESTADVRFVQQHGQEIRAMVAATRAELAPLAGAGGLLPGEAP
jgi:hypothetical protein